MTPYPRLLDNALSPISPLLPLQYSLVDKLSPLSTATIVLPHDAPEVAIRSFVELYDEHGCAGIFRVNNIRTDAGGVRTVALQHGLCTLSDHMHPGESSNTGSCRTLLTKILSNQTRWTLGTVDVPDDQDLTWQCNNTNDLQGLLAIVKELPGYFLDFDMTALPWVLHLRAKSPEVDCEARFDRNLTDVQIEYDTTDMCTLAYADGLDDPIKADTYDHWDEIARHVSVDEDLGQEVIKQSVARYLEQTKNPRVTITLTALELSRLTGEPFDRFRKGMLCRCILDGMTLIQRIETIERPDPIGDPLHVVLTLASAQHDLSVTVAGLVVDTRHVNQLYQQMEKNLRIEAETIEMLAAEISLRAYQEEVDGISARVSQAEILIDGLEAEISLVATQGAIDELSARLSSAEIRIDGAEAAIELKAEQSTVSAMEQRLSQAKIDIDGANAQISLKASQSTVDDLGERVTSAELLIDGQNSKIEAKADLILLDGYVKADELETEVITVLDSAMIDSISCGSIVSGSGDFDDLWCGQINGETLTSSTLTMGATTATLFAPSDINLAHSHAVTVDGGTVTLGEVSSSGGSFNIADTQFYKDGVSAAKESGYNAGRLDYKPSAASISATVSGASDYQISVSLTNVYGNNVGTFSGLSLDARDVYDNGYDDGYAAGVANVTLSGSGWSGDSYTVTASNGTTFIVPAPSVSIAHGVQTASNNVLVIVTTADGTSLAAKNIDVTSVYDAAVESAELAVNETSVDVTFSDGTVKSLDVAEYVTATADVKYVSSTSTTMTVRGWGYAYFNGTYCASAYRNQTYDTAE